ncbi:UNC93-like protein MFSD11 [Lycorma delicatula]|uniref:UNC93-like protein MFSD11 n=1 Tax=Lycorma delicatula TaxID=130591 RepID=UPI003F513C03
MGECDKRLFNVISLGVGFLLVFTAFQTMANIQKTVLESIKKDTKDFTGDGYTSLAIIYVVFSVCNWLAPSVISLCGARLSMILGSITYALFIFSFLFPKTWLLYAASALMGLGAAIIWNGQGNYLTLNSDSTTISRNSGIFWALLQCSLFFGNLYVYFAFQGKSEIDRDTRTTVFTVLTVVCCIGVVVIILLRPAVRADGELVAKDTSSPVEALISAAKMFFTSNMVLLNVVFIYTGLELTFFSGVYSASIGFTQQLGTGNKELVGLSGIFVGAGEIIGGVLFGILGSKTIRWGRSPIVILGFIIHIISFICIGLNLPNASPLGETDDKAIIPSLAWLAILCSFLLGFGDSCFNTQVISLLGGVYSDNSAPAFAIFKFTQSVSCAIAFLYTSRIGLYPQLVILFIFVILGSGSFIVVELRTRRIEHAE